MSNTLNIYNTSTPNYEFIGFSFDGKHSSEFNLTVVNPSMYSENLFSDFDDRVVEVAGKDGVYYFGTQVRTKPLRISVAFDNIDGKNKRDIVNWLQPRKVGKLIFDESPYKYYVVKISSSPVFSFIPFSINDSGNNKHVFKGSFDIEFSSFEPYGYSEYSTVSNVPIWTGSSFTKPYSASLLPEWYLESGLFDEALANTTTPSLNGFTIASSGIGTIPYNFYNGGNSFAITSLEFTLNAFDIGSVSLLLKNITTNETFELKSLKNITALSDSLGPWTIVCDAKTGQIYSTINNIKYNLGALHNGKFLSLAPGNNEWTTNRALTNLKIKYRYTYW